MLLLSNVFWKITPFISDKGRASTLSFQKVQINQFLPYRVCDTVPTEKQAHELFHTLIFSFLFVCLFFWLALHLIVVC